MNWLVGESPHYVVLDDLAVIVKLHQAFTFEHQSIAATDEGEHSEGVEDLDNAQEYKAKRVHPSVTAKSSPSSDRHESIGKFNCQNEIPKFKEFVSLLDDKSVVACKYTLCEQAKWQHLRDIADPHHKVEHRGNVNEDGYDKHNVPHL